MRPNLVMVIYLLSLSICYYLNFSDFALFAKLTFLKKQGNVRLYLSRINNKLVMRCILILSEDICAFSFWSATSPKAVLNGFFRLLAITCSALLPLWCSTHRIHSTPCMHKGEITLIWCTANSCSSIRVVDQKLFSGLICSRSKNWRHPIRITFLLSFWHSSKPMYLFWVGLVHAGQWDLNGTHPLRRSSIAVLPTVFRATSR